MHGCHQGSALSRVSWTLCQALPSFLPRTPLHLPTKARSNTTNSLLDMRSYAASGSRASPSRSAARQGTISASSTRTWSSRNGGASGRRLSSRVVQTTPTPRPPSTPPAPPHPRRRRPPPGKPPAALAHHLPDVGDGILAAVFDVLFVRDVILRRRPASLPQHHGLVHHPGQTVYQLGQALFHLQPHTPLWKDARTSLRAIAIEVTVDSLAPLGPANLTTFSLFGGGFCVLPPTPSRSHA